MRLRKQYCSAQYLWGMVVTVPEAVLCYRARIPNHQPILDSPLKS